MAGRWRERRRTTRCLRRHTDRDPRQHDEQRTRVDRPRQVDRWGLLRLGPVLNYWRGGHATKGGRLVRRSRRSNGLLATAGPVSLLPVATYQRESVLEPEREALDLPPGRLYTRIRYVGRDQ